MYEQEVSLFSSIIFCILLIHGFIILTDITKYVFYINRDSDHQYHHWPFRWTWKEAAVSLLFTVFVMSWTGKRLTDFQFNFLQILFGIYYIIGFLYILKIKE